MKIHFIGIGGIGISGLAQYMYFQGHKISGSDICETSITKQLVSLGIKVNISHSTDAITNQDLIIHSAIIRPDNPEIIAAKNKKIKILARREALSEILKDKKVYSIAGAHGKSTTTAILASIMNGSAVIGAQSKEFNSNVRYTKENNILIFEADESDGSFINSNPYCAIVTNAEPEHMEYYDYNYNLFYDSYKTFLSLAKFRVINAEDSFLNSFCKEKNTICLYPSMDIKNISYILIKDEPHTRFELKNLGIFDVFGLGHHIALDASLAILAAMPCMDIKTIRKNLLNFKGIKKRFDIINLYAHGVVIDDYAHHPTEIRATLESVKEYARLKGFDNITAIWQPHKYSRTIDNLEDFTKCFKGAQELIILPVWAAGEAFRSIDFVQKFKQYNLTMVDSITKSSDGVELVKDKKVIKALNNGLIIGFGAGDITYQLRGNI